jgi:hypothetical protein
MLTETHKPQDLFTLNVVAPHLKDFRPPEGPHDPHGDWTLAYGVYTLGAIRGHGGRIGQLLVRRESGDAGGAVVHVDYRKNVRPDLAQKVAARITCRGGALATPVRWTCSSEIVRAADGAETPIENTRLEKSATAEDGQVEIRDGEHARRLSIPTPFVVNWALFEAVGRLPREPFDPIHFAMLDHFDQIKGDQVLSYRQWVDVLLAGQRARLHAYDHLGQGIVPWVYWVDDPGRLLFAVSGLEAYLLESSRPS